MRRHPRVVIALAAVCLLLTACGARLSDQQRRLAISGYQGGRDTVTQQGGTTAGNGTAGGPESTAPTTGGAAPSTAATTAGGGTGAGGAGGAAGGGGRGGGATTSSGCGSGRLTASDTGVTPTEIDIANIADISGPVPGLFQSARDAVTAFAAYWNSTHGGVCGRKLVVKDYDSQTDANGYRAQMLDACKNDFASVGSMSAFDDGGAQVEDQCGVPDISAAAVTPAHQQSKVTFATEATRAGVVSQTLPGWVAEKYPDAVKHAAFLYINAGASAVNAKADVKAYEAYGHGWDFVYVQPVDISTFNYGPFVEQMKSKGVKFVQWLGAYQQAARLAQAMQQQGFKPDMYLLDPTGYNTDYVQQGGSAVDGTYVYLDSAMFEDAASNKEMATYLTWLKRVAGGNAQPAYFGVFAWSAALLFVTLAEQIGPDLTRAKMIAALKKVRGWTGNGIHSPQDVGLKITSKCFGFIQLQGGTWKHVHPSRPGYDCRPLIGG